jgi:hypothetical protein
MILSQHSITKDIFDGPRMIYSPSTTGGRSALDFRRARLEIVTGQRGVRDLKTGASVALIDFNSDQALISDNGSSEDSS